MMNFGSLNARKVIGILLPIAIVVVLAYAFYYGNSEAKTSAVLNRTFRSSTPLVLGAPLFRFETDEAVAPDSANFVHYEILYRGTTYDYRGAVYHLLYREYRRENPSLPLYEQDLEFSSSVTTVDVLGLRMRVHDVNETQIVYTVLTD